MRPAFDKGPICHRGNGDGIAADAFILSAAQFRKEVQVKNTETITQRQRERERERGNLNYYCLLIRAQDRAISPLVKCVLFVCGGFFRRLTHSRAKRGEQITNNRVVVVSETER